MVVRIYDYINMWMRCVKGYDYVLNETYAVANDVDDFYAHVSCGLYHFLRIVGVGDFLVW